MVVTPPEKKISQAQIDALINKGGSVPSDKITIQKKTAPVLLHIPVQILEKVDREVTTRQTMKRVSWILEAIVEKLEKDSSV
jgi:hypothetical protein